MVKCNLCAAHGNLIMDSGNKLTAAFMFAPESLTNAIVFSQLYILNNYYILV